jgi:hypothetical protein
MRVERRLIKGCINTQKSIVQYGGKIYVGPGVLIMMNACVGTQCL